MTAKTPERIQREAAREFGEQLAVVVSECNWDEAENWLSIHMRDAKFSERQLILVLASMTDEVAEYRALVKERRYPVGGAAT